MCPACVLRPPCSIWPNATQWDVCTSHWMELTGNPLEGTHVIGINSLPFDLSFLGRTFDAAPILLTTKQKWNTKDSVSVVYCCVTNHPRLSGLKQYHLFAHNSIWRAKLGCSSTGLSLRLCTIGNWLRVGWSWMASTVTCLEPHWRCLEKLGWLGLSPSGFILHLVSFSIWFPFL